VATATTEEAQAWYELPLSDVLALPSLALEDLERGFDWLDGLASGRVPERRPVIHIPGWDDIFHVIPERWLPEEEQIRRRRERAQRIRESPTPESVRALSSILTWIDNVQDALVTASVLTRLAAVFYKPLVPVAVGLGEAAEAINIFGLAGSVGVSTLGGKFRTQRMVRNMLGGQVARALKTRTFRAALPSVGEWIQILQTTDNLFGVGLSLGPIAGLFEELIFGLPQGAEFAFGSGPRFRPGDEALLEDRYIELAREGKLNRHFGTLFRGAQSAARVLAVPDELSWSDRMDALVLLSIALELGRGIFPVAKWEPLILPVLDQPRPPSRQIPPHIAIALRSLGIRPEEHERFPLPGSPDRLSPREEAWALLQAGIHALQDWLPKAPTGLGRVFSEALGSDLGFRAVRALEGTSAGFEVHNAPRWRAVIDSLELGLIPPRTATKASVEAYLAAAKELYDADPSRETPIRELRTLHRQIFGS